MYELRKRSISATPSYRHKSRVSKGAMLMSSKHSKEVGESDDRAQLLTLPETGRAPDDARSNASVLSGRQSRAAPSVPHHTFAH